MIEYDYWSDDGYRWWLIVDDDLTVTSHWNMVTSRYIPPLRSTAVDVVGRTGGVEEEGFAIRLPQGRFGWTGPSQPFTSSGWEFT